MACICTACMCTACMCMACICTACICMASYVWLYMHDFICSASYVRLHMPFQTADKPYVLERCFQLFLLPVRSLYCLLCTVCFVLFAFFYISIADSSSRNCSIPMKRIPFSSCHGSISSLTTTIFLKESCIFVNGRISCFRFSSSGMAKAD